MSQIILDIQPQTANKFNNYIQLFGSNEFRLEQFIDYQINKVKREISRMQFDLEKYETKYNIPSSDFYKRFENGEFGDENDYMLWAGIYELQLDSRNKLSKLC